MFKKLKNKWGIKNDFQLFIIIIVFGITGTASVKLGEPLLDILSIGPELFSNLPFGKFIYFLFRVLIIFPLYQVLLIIFGALFFQFKFFWEFEKKMLRKMGIKI
ncbi:MAG: diacylglyceryl transferase [Flavobacteriaceae bacterium]|nr:diacylglyceryl transferase [Flavobacteriaceae bacterium]